MTTFRATVAVDDTTLTTSRPITAPETVARLIDSVVYEMSDGDAAASGVTSIELVVQTSGESDTPIADSVSGTSSTPLTASDATDGDTVETVDTVDTVDDSGATAAAPTA